jgi:shikimate kinase
MNIYLIGFMGAGKSHWGKIWAEKSGLEFLDLDDLLEEKWGDTVTGLFAHQGEAWFREREQEMLHAVSLNSSRIVACGGGTPCYFDNMDWMNQQGITVYLNASPQELFSRLYTETSKRPLINGMDPNELKGFIEKKLSERVHFYEKSRVILDVALLTPETIKEILRNHA